MTSKLRLIDRKNVSDEPLTRRSDHDRMPECNKAIQMLQNQQVVLHALAESDARVEYDLTGLNAPTDGVRSSLTEKIGDRPDDIVILRASASLHVFRSTRRCINTTGTPAAATTSAISSSSRNADTSFTMSAPATRAAFATDASRVSTEIGVLSSTSRIASITGTARAICRAAETGA